MVDTRPDVGDLPVMTAYETTRQRHLRYLQDRLVEHLERLHWSAERLRVERTARLRQLLAIARAKSAWHRPRLKAVDIDHIDEDRLGDVPPMTKDDLMAHFDQIVTDPRVTLAGANAHIAGLTSDDYFLGDLHAVASGGSTGIRGVFVWGWEAWAEAVLPNVRRQVYERMTQPDLATAPAVSMLVAAEKAAHFSSAAAQTFATSTDEIHRFPLTLPLTQIVEGLNRVNGSYLGTFASVLSTLASEARAGRLTISPRRIISMSEPLLPEIRQAVGEVWNAPIANLWGTSEGGVTAVGCYRDTGMHLSDDLVIVEPVDERSDPVPAGTLSAKVLVTNLYNPVLPLIRYEITDEVTLLDEPCACGSAHRRIADVQGRLEDTFTYEGGVVVAPFVFQSVLARDARILEYQVCQTIRGADIFILTSEPVPAEPLARQLEAALVRVGLCAPLVSAKAVDRLPRQPTGKLKRFVPL